MKSNTSNREHAPSGLNGLRPLLYMFLGCLGIWALAIFGLVRLLGD